VTRSDTAEHRLFVALAPVVFILLAGIMITASVTDVVHDAAGASYSAKYGAGRVAAIHTLQSGVERYVKVLHGAAGLLNASHFVTEAEFRRYGEAIGLPGSDPGMDTIGVVHPAAWDDLATTAVELEAEQPATALTIPDPKPHELAISWLTTSSPATSLIGYDVGADPARRAALYRARDTGQAVMTAPVVRVADQSLPKAKQQASFVLYVPVYSHPKVPATVAERRATLVAWTATAVRLPDMLRALHLASGTVDVAILGRTDQSADVLGSTIPAGQILDNGRVHFDSISVDGRTWRLAFSPAPALGAPGDGWWATLLVGLCITLALASVIGLLLTQRTRLRRRVRAALAEQDETNQRLEQESDFQRALIDNLGVGVLVVDVDGHARAYNLLATGSGMVNLHRSERESWSDFFGLYDPATGAPMVDADSPIDRSIRGERVEGMELLVRQGDLERYVRCSSRPVRTADGVITGAVCTVADITDLRVETVLLSRRANTDALTGLANRAAVCERLEERVAEQATGGGAVGVVYLDLDDFKPVNDTYGHEVGDKLLQVVARRLQGAVRPTDLAARLGGDEFVVVCDDPDSAGGIERLAERIGVVLAQPFAVGHRQLSASASVGAVRSRPHDDASSVLDRADRAMYEAKRRHRSTADAAGSDSQEADRDADQLSSRR
jgi:diguanylate cyclase (GGDEF)-like protein